MRAMWSHQPAGRPVTATTRLPAACSLSRAEYASAVSLPSVVSASSMSESRPSIARASSCASGFIGPSFADYLLHTPPLSLAHQQAAFRPAPQNILGAARPLVLGEVRNLALGQPGAVFLSQLAVRHYLVRLRAVAPENGAQGRRWNRRMASEEGIARVGTRLRAEIASRERLTRSPGGPQTREIRCEAVQRFLRQTSIGRDLAAEHRKHRRHSRVVVDP